MFTYILTCSDPPKTGKTATTRTTDIKVVERFSLSVFDGGFAIYFVPSLCYLLTYLLVTAVC